MKLIKCDICGQIKRAYPGEYHRSLAFGLDICPTCWDEWNRLRTDEIRQLMIDEIRNRITEDRK